VIHATELQCWLTDNRTTEEAARLEAMSKSRITVKCVDSYCKNGSLGETVIRLQTDIALKEEIISMRDNIVKQQTELINELQASLTFMRHGYSILSQKLLPPR
jgi:cobalamin biosynthesis Mg chelatase CobN